MLISQFVPISIHSQKSLIQVTCTLQNLIRSKQSLMMEYQSISIHFPEMPISQFVPIAIHSQISLIQVTHTEQNLICSKQSLMMESQSNGNPQSIGKLLNRMRFQEMIHGCEIVHRPRILRWN
jgi:hypothetical protein